MSRFEFGGHGDPIPLPEDGLEAFDPDNPNRLPMVIVLPHGTIFKAADYSAFGYTHYEVSVIGASGGSGGAAIAGDPTSYNWERGIISTGGAGGGGGLHVVTGALEDLPPEVLVTVGQQGSNGARGGDAPQYVPAQNPYLTNGNHLAVTQELPPNLPYYGADGVVNFPYVLDNVDGIVGHGGYVMLPNVSLEEAETWGVFIVPEAFFRPYEPAEDGGDGGASKFGDIAMASGGKGGKKSPFTRRYQWAGYPSFPGGDGGEGGIGGTDVAGGGAPGSYSPVIPEHGPFPASYGLIESRDGTWDGEIGEGGGGGRGGSNRPRFQNWAQGTEPGYFSNKGSKGSFNFGDTSRYGPGEEGNGLVPGTGGGATTNRRVPGSIFGGGWTEGPYSSLYGQLPGRNPNGVVQIRLTQIV